MKRTVTLLLLLGGILFARENPFFPPKGASVPSYSTNRVTKPKPFTKALISLPNTARVLQSVSVTYENLDGSLSTKQITINQSIDWHNKILITQKRHNQQTTQPKKQKHTHYKKIGSVAFISFYTSGKKMRILTKDRLLRNFKLVKPDRIVLDFKRDADFRTYSFKGERIFRKITLGNHAGYYRAVIELDGRYLHHIEKIPNGYLLELE